LGKSEMTNPQWWWPKRCNKWNT